jgi:hypothetical protein
MELILDKHITFVIKKKKSSKIHNAYWGIIYAKDWFDKITMILIQPEDLVVIGWYDFHDGINSHVESKTTFKLKNMFTLKPGDKFILNEDYNWVFKNWQNQEFKHSLPKNLVFQIISYHASLFGSSICIKILRNKKLINEIYQGIEEKYYIPEGKWRFFIMQYFHNKECENFMNANFSGFNDEYYNIINKVD